MTAVRAVVSRHADWRQTARLAAEDLARRLPSPDVLTAEQRIGHPETYRSHVLSTEPDGSVSIVALVWRPGQVTPIHDHVTYGTDVSRIGSSVRRYYDHPIAAATKEATR